MAPIMLWRSAGFYVVRAAFSQSLLPHRVHNAAISRRLLKQNLFLNNRTTWFSAIYVVFYNPIPCLIAAFALYPTGSFHVGDNLLYAVFGKS